MTESRATLQLGEALPLNITWSKSSFLGCGSICKYSSNNDRISLITDRDANTCMTDTKQRGDFEKATARNGGLKKYFPGKETLVFQFEEKNTYVVQLLSRFRRPKQVHKSLIYHADLLSQIISSSKKAGLLNTDKHWICSCNGVLALSHLDLGSKFYDGS